MKIERLNAENCEEAGQALAEAFMGYPMMRFFYGEDHAPYVRTMFGMATRGRVKLGGTNLVAIQEGKVLGVALMEWPDDPKWTPEMEADWDAFAATHPEFSAARFEAYGDLKKASRPEEPHVYLGAIGVHPSAQGTGVGGALLREISRIAAPLPVWLDTQLEKNCRLYEHHGYEIRAHHDLQGVPFWVLEAKA